MGKEFWDGVRDIKIKAELTGEDLLIILAAVAGCCHVDIAQELQQLYETDFSNPDSHHGCELYKSLLDAVQEAIGFIPVGGC